MAMGRGLSLSPPQVLYSPTFEFEMSSQFVPALIAVLPGAKRVKFLVPRSSIPVPIYMLPKWRQPVGTLSNEAAGNLSRGSLSVLSSGRLGLWCWLEATVFRHVLQTSVVPPSIGSFASLLRPRRISYPCSKIERLDSFSSMLANDFWSLWTTTQSRAMKPVLDQIIKPPEPPSLVRHPFLPQRASRLPPGLARAVSCCSSFSRRRQSRCKNTNW